MLHIHFSNRYESLARLLIGKLATALPCATGAPGVAGTADVFAAAQVIVPSQAVAKALTLAIADHDGICANVSFGYLASWLWGQISRLVPTVGNTSPFETDVLAWRIYRTLGEQDFVAAHRRLHDYLRSADASMRYELACRLAALIRDYSTYREDWLEAWADGRRIDCADQHLADERWQGALYRRIVADLHVDTRHPGAAFIDALDRQGGAAAIEAGLPASVHIFVLPTMPPQHLRLVQYLGTRIDVQVYVLNPCREYWFEVVDRRRLSYLAAAGRAQYHEEGNRLLASWGRQTQAHVDLLVDQDGAVVSDENLFARQEGGTLLAQVQNSILDLAQLPDGAVSLAADDRSIEVHDCHSLTRELEVLHDYLLDLFAGEERGAPTLRPSDILVVTPDLEAAAPLIEAVFGTVPPERAIPFELTGRSRTRANAPARNLLALLSLAASRFEATAVFDLLQQPIVARRFGLDDEDLQQVRDWIAISGIRWALDDAQRAQFGVPGQTRHTVADGMERLFLGYALPRQSGAALFGQMLPAGHAAGSDALALGAFWRFVDALRRFHATASAPQRAPDWAQCLTDAIGTFMAASRDELDDLNELQLAVNQLHDTMQRGGITGEVPLAVIQGALEQLLAESVHGGVPTGRVTFTSMSSLRSLPFEIVCVIGLNDGAFPTAARTAEFDLMAARARRGDRQRAADERNLFLDLVLAARRRLYLSYTGRSVRDNSLLPPSVLISELLDVLVPAVAGTGVRDRLVIRHPLQAFALECFAAGGDPRVRSYNREMGAALLAGLQAPPRAIADDRSDDDGDGAGIADAQPPFFAAPLSAAGPEWREVSLQQLVEFFRNPSRYLLKLRMGIELRYEPDELLDQEPFLLDWRGQRSLAQRLVPRLIRDPDDALAMRLIESGTEMPSGNLGAYEVARELKSLREFAGHIRQRTRGELLAPHQASASVDIGDEIWRLGAVFADLPATGLVCWNYEEQRNIDALRGADALEAWISHLLLCVDAPRALTLRTTVIARNGIWTFRAPQDSRALLAQLIGIYRQGLAEPVHFFPKSAWAYCHGDHQVAKALHEWRVTREHAYGESGNVAYRLAFRGQPEPIDAEFRRLARTVFDPLIAHCDKET